MASLRFVRTWRRSARVAGSGAVSGRWFTQREMAPVRRIAMSRSKVRSSWLHDLPPGAIHLREGPIRMAYMSGTVPCCFSTRYLKCVSRTSNRSCKSFFLPSGGVSTSAMPDRQKEYHSLDSSKDFIGLYLFTRGCYSRPRRFRWGRCDLSLYVYGIARRRRLARLRSRAYDLQASALLSCTETRPLGS
jgi:hypothetical protein